MTAAELLLYVKEGGAYSAPLLLAALLWMNADRNRLIAALDAKSKKVEDLAERLYTVSTELRTFLFSERRA